MPKHVQRVVWQNPRYYKRKQRKERIFWGCVGGLLAEILHQISVAL